MKEVKKILAGINKLPPMPEVMGKILRISDNPTASAKEIIDIIKYDQNITANVLRLCNSSYYSLPRHISSLNDAVVMLGNRTLYNVILAGFAANIVGKENIGYQMEKGGLWEHSVSCAILAKELAKRVGYEDEQLAYSTGLMHDTGKVVLDSFIQENEDKILDKVTEQKEDFDKVEEDILGLSHAEIGALLSESWKFPKEITDGIRYHHRPEDAEENKILVNIIHIADALAVMFGFGSGIDGLNYHVSDIALNELGLTENEIYSLSPHLISEVKKAKDMVTVK